jgi:23S rRNA pseudouridine1911/1915/1917 synthase
MQFEMRQVFKEYVAITHGTLDRDSDYIERRIGHHPHDRIKMIATDDRERGKDASTFYEVLERFAGYTFVRCQPRTGRTHQIRVHLQAIGYPVAGDPEYGKADQLGLSRQFLHAARLAFDHPVTGEPVDVESPLPADLADVLDRLNAGNA